MSTAEQGADGLADGAFYEAFEAGRISKETFRHREHVRLGFIYLSRHSDLADGALRFRQAFRRFAAAQGVAHAYNETLTWAYLVLIHERIRGAAPARDSFDFMRRNPDLCDHRNGVIARYYDLDRVTRSPVAKEVFVLPRERP